MSRLLGVVGAGMVVALAAMAVHPPAATGQDAVPEQPAAGAPAESARSDLERSLVEMLADQTPRGPGLYLNLLKLAGAIFFFFLWGTTVHWADNDLRQQALQGLAHTTWNPFLFFGGLIGLSAFFVIPVYPVALVAALSCYGVPTFSYVVLRNRLLPEDDRVLTSLHLQRLAARLLGKKVAPVSKTAPVGPPIRFIGRTATGDEDPTRQQAVEASRGYMTAKELVYDAIVRRATDVHLEPKRDAMTVRYRIDGILHASDPMPRDVGDAVINVFKILAAMDIAERRKPQDGSFGAQLEGRELDFRIATAGSVLGEKLVMRILDRDAALLSLAQLGMPPKIRERVTSIVHEPHGMLLVCGPTGAGKTTTLYACLRELDAFTKNIITIENPIEYQLPNVTQQEVNPKANLTFASALRSILRQDPDVIMVGEIRDQETATIAAQAAQTGHMVFSTLHANDCVTSLFRLMDLKVEPHQIASALTALLSQRLVRVLCEACREAYKPKPEFLKKANLPPEKIGVFYRPPSHPEQVCARCGGVGYFGRTGIFELMNITDRMRDIIQTKPEVNLIKAEARKAGMLYLQEEGLKLVIRGKTSIEELMRVIK